MLLGSGQIHDQNSLTLLVKTAFASPSGAGNNAFIGAVAGKKIRVIAYRLQGTGTVVVKFTDTDGADVSMSWTFQAREGCSVNSPPNSFEFETPVGKGLQINLSGAVQANVSVQYIEIVPFS